MDCPICLFTFNESNFLPLILQCGHTVCKSCILSLYAIYPFKCPLDRSLIEVPLNEIKPNYALQEIMANYTLSKLNEPQNPTKVCALGHMLQKSINSSIINTNKGKPQNMVIICSHCLLPGLNFSYSCYQCNFNLCEKCYCEQAQSTFIEKSQEKIKCLNNHFMFRYLFIDNFYMRRFSMFSSICCEVCKKRWNGVSSACKICCFNLCDDCCSRDFHSLIKRPPEMCVGGHELEVNDRDEFGVGLEGVRCSECFTGLEGKIASCGVCFFYLCGDCYRLKWQSLVLKDTTGLVCGNKHSLELVSDSDEYYRSKYGKYYSMICYMCSINFIGRSFSCRECEFDICLKCKDRDNGTISFGLCGRNHELRIMKISFSILEYECSVCKLKSSESGLYCKWCNYTMCPNCNIYFKNSEFLEIRCPKSHQIVHSPDQLNNYEKRFSRRAFSCNGCSKLLSQLSNYHCRKCEFDLCEDCYKTILNGMNNGIMVKCFNEHELEYCFYTTQIYGSFYFCDLCRNNVNECGSFHCTLCKFDVCLSCSYILVNK